MLIYAIPKHIVIARGALPMSPWTKKQRKCWDFCSRSLRRNCPCSRHGVPYIRGWMQMVLAPNDLFSWNNNTMRRKSCMGLLHYCCTMHNGTHSVHNRSLKPWWGRLPCSQTFYVFSPPLSGLNWHSLSIVGGPGPPTPKVVSPLLGSAHTPLPGYGTVP